MRMRISVCVESCARDQCVIHSAVKAPAKEKDEIIHPNQAENLFLIFSFLFLQYVFLLPLLLYF